MLKILVLSIVFLITSCQAGNEVNKLDSLWHEVTSSLNADDEARAIEKIWKYNAANSVVIRVFSITKDGREIDVHSINNIQAINKLKIDFSQGDYNGSLEWSPLKNDNVFILFRE